MPKKIDSPPPEQQPTTTTQTPSESSELREQAEGAVRQHFQSTDDHPADAQDQTGHQKHK